MSPDQVRRAFRRNPDGSWSCVQPATIPHPTGRIEIAVGTRLERGRRFMGVDVVAWIEDRLSRG
ncbi:MAG: hypothetical protein ACREUH_02260 [Burkholderiales bacterium]